MASNPRCLSCGMSLGDKMHLIISKINSEYKKRAGTRIDATAITPRVNIIKEAGINIEEIFDLFGIYLECCRARLNALYIEDMY